MKLAKVQLPYILLVLALLQGCALFPVTDGAVGKPSPGVVARNKNFIVVRVGPGETFATLAEKYLSSAEREDEISKFNAITSLHAGQTVAIPLRRIAVPGVNENAIQTVPILCYHRFGPGGGKMTVSTDSFSSQLRHLNENHYNIIPLDYLVDFLAGKRDLAPRSVVITIDDGYRSTYDVAFPILKKYAFHATVFLYTDFVGARDALTWAQMQEMTDSGLVSIQPHTKTHANLAIQFANESDDAYRRRLEAEIDQSGDAIAHHLGIKPSIFAYPYGDSNDTVAALLRKNQYGLGVTVQAGVNTFFSPPFLLKRTMIYGDQDIEEFAKTLVVQRELTMQ